VLRKIFGLKKMEETGGWRKLRSTTKMIKSSRMRKVGSMARGGTMKKACRVLVEIYGENDHLEYLCVDGSIIVLLQKILTRRMFWHGL
jgi:hypothetical protein